MRGNARPGYGPFGRQDRNIKEGIPCEGPFVKTSRQARKLSSGWQGWKLICERGIVFSNGVDYCVRKRLNS